MATTPTPRDEWHASFDGWGLEIEPLTKLVDRVFSPLRATPAPGAEPSSERWPPANGADR